MPVRVSMAAAADALSRSGTAMPATLRQVRGAVDSVEFMMEKPLPKNMAPKAVSNTFDPELSAPWLSERRADPWFEPQPSPPASLTLTSSWTGLSFDTNASLAGKYQVPPDPDAAVGGGYVVTVVNTSIGWYTTSGTGATTRSLASFFSSLSPASKIFDPRVVYDPFSGRFVVIVLDRDTTTGTSGILVATSQTANPGGAWRFARLNTALTINSASYWADYPSVSVDEEAVYLTANMYSFSSGSYGGTRLWIVDKNALYSGSAVAPSPIDPFAAVSSPSLANTLRPAAVFPPARAAGSGTWLLTYSGLSDGTNEFVAAIRLTNPLTSPALALTLVNLGNIDNTSSAIPEAPQAGTSTLVETNDRRMLDAAVRNGSLVGVATIRPALGADAGQATAAWLRIAVDNPSSPSLADFGTIGGEEIASGAHTFFPSVSLGPDGSMAVGFSASSPSTYPGAYATMRLAGDAAGSTVAPVTVRAGESYYYRAFGGSSNRWGDYTATVADPSDDGSFWVFNEYAATRGTVLSSYPTEDGRWGTVVGRIAMTTPNELPTASPATLSTAEDTPGQVTLVGNDPEGAPLTFSVSSQPAHGSVTLSGPTATYTPTPNWHGTDQFTFRVYDGSGYSAPATVTVTVTAVNDAPTVSSAAVAVNAGQPTPISLAGADVDGDPLDFSVVTPPQHGTASVTGSVVTYTPAPGFAGSDSFTFRAHDGVAFSDPATISLTVTATNAAPVAIDAAVAADEDTSPAIALSASDADGDPLTYEIVTPPQHGSVQVSGSTATYTPPANWHGQDAFTFRASDGQAFSNTASATVTIAPVNDAPTASPASGTTDEDAQATVALSGTDPDGDELTFTVVTPPSHGSVSIEGSTATYTPDADWNGSDGFTFRAHDGQEYSPMVSAAVTVLPVNDAPTALPVAGAGPEDGSIQIALQGADVDGDDLSFRVVTLPQHGTVSIAGATATYVPGAHWSGTDSFTYGASDGAAESQPAVVSIEVSPVNDPPSAASRMETVPEDMPLTVVLSGSDPDGDALTVSLAALPQHGSVTLAGSVATYTPASDWYGIDSWSYRVSDGQAQSAPAVVSVTVTPVNDAPTAWPVSGATPENTPVAIGLSASDPEGQSLVYSLYTLPQHGSVTISGVAATYVPSPGYSGTDSFSYRAFDGSAYSNVATVTVSVSNVNDAPVAEPVSGVTDEDTLLDLALSGSDPDGDALTWQLVAPPQHGSVVLQGSTATYTPAPDWHGEDVFAVRASDGQASSNVATATVTVAPVNDAPTAGALAGSGDEDSDVTVALSGEDVDGDPLSFEIVAQPSYGTVVLSGSAAVYSPSADWHGQDTFTYRALDGQAASAAVGVSISVLPVNDAPIAIAGSASGEEDAAVSVPLSGSDVDGDALSFELVDAPAHGTVTIVGASATYVPGQDWHGEDHFTFRSNDGRATSGAATVTVTVAPVNDAPVAAALSRSTGEDQPTTFALPASDVDGDALVYDVVSAPQHGTVTLDGAMATYTPAQDYTGSDAFAFRASDGSSWSNAAVVSLSVDNSNDVPVAHDVAKSTSEDTGIAIALSASDADGDALEVAAITAPGHGTVSVVGLTATYVPNPDWNGQDHFSYRVTDGSATSAEATVTVTVAPVNDAPVATPVSGSTDEDATATIALSASDVDGDALSFVLVTAPQHGTVTIDGAAAVYRPARDWYGQDGFTWRASDGKASSVPVQASVTVAPVNDAPVSVAVSGSTDEDTPAQIALSGSDVDGDALSFSVEAMPRHGSVTVTGSIARYVPEPDWHGTDSFTVRASDGTASSAAVPATVTVSPVNDAPVAADLARSTAEDQPTTFALPAVDVDGDALVYDAVSSPQHGTVTLNGPMATYTPAPDYTGNDAFTFRAFDGTAWSNVATASISVDDRNDPPTAAPVAASTAEDQPVSIALTADDPDGDALTFLITAQPGHGSVALEGATVTYTPAADWNGEDSFAWVASDGVAVSDAATVTVTVTPVNDVPDAMPLSATTLEDEALDLALQGTDRDGDALRYALVDPPTNGTVTVSEGVARYVPNADWHGSDRFTYRAEDDESQSTPAEVEVTVEAVNDAPVAEPVSAMSREDEAVSVALGAVDPDGEPVSFEIVAGPTHGTVSVSGLDAIFTPAPDWSGQDSFTFRALDGSTASEPAVATIIVEAVNDAPVASPASAEGAEDTALTIPLTGSDVDGDALTFSIDQAPQDGTVTLAGGIATYVPHADWSGSDAFTFVVSDGFESSAPASVSVTIAGTNDAPVAEAASAETDEDVSVDVPLAGSDPDGDPVRFEIAGAPEHGTVTVDGAVARYTPEPDWNGTDAFTIVAGDGSATSAPATVVVTVRPVNDLPTEARIVSPIDGATIQVDAGPDAEFEVVWTESTDPDGDAVTYEWQLSESPTFDVILSRRANASAVSLRTTVEALAEASRKGDASRGPAGLAANSMTLYHRVQSSDGTGTTIGPVSSVVLEFAESTAVDPADGLVTETRLEPGYPNPFNDHAVVRFALATPGPVRLEVYDLAGRRVASLVDRRLEAGRHEERFDASDLPSGLYFCRLEAGGRVHSTAMALVR